MNAFLTSNQQFGRKGAIRAYKRPFETVDEMNQYLINQWNSVVSDGDIVFVLGNFIWDPETARDVYRQLNGNICVLDGEWDKAIDDIINNSSLQIDHIDDQIHKIPDASLCLSYWPLSQWPGKKDGYTSVVGYPNKKYGTSHTKNILNVTCDFWDYKPVRAKNIIDLFNDLKSEDN